MTEHGPFLEVWLPAVGYDGYEVSNAGRVRSMTRTIPYLKMGVWVQRTYKGRILRPAPNQSGHLGVVLGRSVGTVHVHKLVIEAFVGPRPSEKFECRHLNGFCRVNWPCNLEWGTRSQNVLDAYAHGARGRGSMKKNAKLCEADIPDIRARCRRESFASVGRLYGVSEATIRQVFYGLTWRHV